MEINKKVLMIDDQKEILESLKKLLTGKDSLKNITNKVEDLVKDFFDTPTVNDEKEQEIYEVFTAERGEKGYMMIKEALESGEPFSVVTIDMRMPGWDGLKTATEIRKIDKNIEIVIVTAYTDRKREEILLTVGTPEKLLYLKKPFDREEILQVMLSLTLKWSLEKEVYKQMEVISDNSKGLEQVIFGIDEIERIKPPTVTVILKQVLKQLMNLFNLKDGYIELCDESECILSGSGNEKKLKEIIFNHFEKESKEYIFEENEYIFIRFSDDGKNVANAVFEKKDNIKLKENELNRLKIFYSHINNIIRNGLLYYELEKANAELIERNEKLKEANELNRKFLVVSSHELRTPITLMSGYIQLLEGEMYSSELEEKKIYDGLKISTKRLTKIINNMLEMFAISGRGQDIVVNRENYAVDEIFAELYEKVKMFLEIRNIKLILKNSSAANEIYVDKLRIVDSVLFNLVMNAIKSSPDGNEIIVELRKNFEGKKEISVKDFGIGISEKDKKNIFTPFFVAGDEKKHHSGVYEYRAAGIGLGLTIVKSILDIMGYEIRCYSEVDKGAEFVFNIEK